MAADERFEAIQEEELLNLLENKDSQNTKRVVKGAVKLFDLFCSEKNIDFINKDLNETLKKFYAGARSKSREFYSKKSLMAIRYGLQKHFEKEKGVDIVNGNEFKEANKSFSAMLIRIKQEGKGTVQHKSPLSKEDLSKLYNSFDLSTPKGLQDKVFIDFMLYFCNRGRENLRALKTSDFIVNENNIYIVMKDHATKNHSGDIRDDASQGGRIYKSGSPLCPFDSFLKYLSKLHPMCEYFFQRPKCPRDVNHSNIWYENIVVGKNSLGTKMKTLSKEAGLSREYTNHCLKATSVTLLESIEARHVIKVLELKSEARISSYVMTGNDQKQTEMAKKISATAGLCKTVLYKAFVRGSQG